MTGHRTLPADPAAYQALIGAFLDLGYVARGFADAEPGERHLILRHDIDVALAEAETIAELEARIGVAACYFVQMRCDLYNPAAPANRGRLARIGALGHRIGLHFDASPHTDAGTLERAVEADCAALEALTGAPVETISFHKPAESLLGRAAPLAGRRHTYEPRFFDDMAYCSDSQGAWRHGHPLDRDEVAAGRAIQLLTHPVWWCGRGATPTAVLDMVLGRRAGELGAEIARSCTSYAAPRVAVERP